MAKPPHGAADRRAEIRRRKRDARARGRADDAARRAGRAEDLAARRARTLDDLEALPLVAWDDDAAPAGESTLAADLEALELANTPIKSAAPLHPAGAEALEALADQYPPRGRRR